MGLNIYTCPYCGSENFEWVGDVFDEDNETPYHCHECDCWFNEETIIRENIRHKMSTLLMNTDEDNQVKLDIFTESDETFGLSSLQIPVIETCYQEPCEGRIWFHFEGSVDSDTLEKAYVNFDDMDIVDLKNVLKVLECYIDL